MDTVQPVFDEFLQERFDQGQTVKGSFNNALMLESLFEALMHSGIQITLSQLLNLVPEFKNMLFQNRRTTHNN